jgi:hypothetical protein
MTNNKRYYLFQSFSRIKIGEINQEQFHLENYEDLSHQIQSSYLLVTYPYSQKQTLESFFSPFIESVSTNQRTFFHYFFSSYFYLIDSLVLLNEQGIYPIRFNEETIFFNREKLPILFLPLNYHRSQNNSTEYFIGLIQHLSKEDLYYLPVEFHILFFLERENKSRFIRENIHNEEDISLFENKTKEEMMNALVPLHVRDNCAHILIPLNK